MIPPYSNGPYIMPVNSKGLMYLPASIANANRELGIAYQKSAERILFCYTDKRWQKLAEKWDDVSERRLDLPQILGLPRGPEMILNMTAMPLDFVGARRAKIPSDIRPEGKCHALIRKLPGGKIFSIEILTASS
jgi:hypothetical protein